ncbi:DUF2569 domain-containing protein [Clostridium sp. OS1-26]|uniref:DUF2569 domain-containing protein n=1 Tax=Clostridium sp. OS1-26 TaxID=3070681 RepID=UPI0027DFB49E|nr:DUF2569 domain-containing protein [Clostridium sp. OS1-26]WML34442.1 DUF2569 domain-containing protein [Clostridium sp. OS1-26]
MDNQEIHDELNSVEVKTLDRPKGIRGWLILVMLQVFSNFLNLFMSLQYNLTILDNSKLLNTLANPSHLYYSPNWKPVILFETIIEMGLLIYIAITLIFFFNAKKRAINMMIIFYILLAIYPIAVVIARSQVPYLTQEYTREDYIKLISSVIASLIWITYFIKSKRVKNTFIN